MGCIRTCRGPVTARKLTAEESEHECGQQGEHEPSHPSRQVREKDVAPGYRDIGGQEKAA